jgi:hypothetical protein
MNETATVQTLGGRTADGPGYLAPDARTATTVRCRFVEGPSLLGHSGSVAYVAGPHSIREGDYLERASDAKSFKVVGVARASVRDLYTKVFLEARTGGL